MREEGLAVRAGACLVTDEGTHPGKVCRGQVVSLGDGITVEGKVLLSAPTNSDQLETKRWF